MAEQLTKSDKTLEETKEVYKFVTKKDHQKEDVQMIYETWTDLYEHDLGKIGYTPPLALANEVTAFYGEKRDLKILDAAAGTGMAGELLHTRGFRNLDALDASAQMLEKAKEKGVYGQFYQEYLGKNRLNIPDGGHIMILMNERYFHEAPDYTRNLEPRMLELQEQGMWKRIVKKTGIQGYHDPDTGVLFVLEKC